MTSSYPKVAGTIRSKNPLKGAIEVIPERLYYAALKAPPPSHNILASVPRRNKSDPPTAKKQIHFFNIDSELVYWNFFLDFGPLNLGQFHRFCAKLNDKLRKFPIVCFYSSTASAKRANAIFLICAWQLLYLERTPEEAYSGFDMALLERVGSHGSQPPVSQSQGAVTTQPLPPFHDASPCACTFDLTVLDCLRGMHKARQFGFFDHSTFDVEEYEHFEQVENGDLNWIIKDKILAFAGPSYQKNVSPEGYCTLAPSDYIPYFQRKNVCLVIRLNKKMYHEEDFIKAGIRHMESFYPDGSCPPMKMLYKVLEAFESVPADKGFAIHCKAGLGRTGTCIGAYMMKHYGFTAREAIGWMRICRPGCVIGPQQQFLQQIEERMWHDGEQYRARVPRPLAAPSTDTEDDIADHEGQAGQADGLLAARQRRAHANAVPTTPEQNGYTGPAIPVTPDSKLGTNMWCN
jgi:cell division cycle 14